jgi:TusA-related sulfurtransferase
MAEKMDISSIACDMYVDISGPDFGKPFTKLTKSVEALEPGKILLAVTKAVAMQNEVPAYCRQMNLKLIEQLEHKGTYYFLMRK